MIALYTLSFLLEPNILSQAVLYHHLYWDSVLSVQSYSYSYTVEL